MPSWMLLGFSDSAIHTTERSVSSEGTETLFREQVAAFNEATLTRMLVRLRRMAVVGFGAAPAG